VNHFQASRTRADIAKTTQHDSCSKLRLLLPRKMKKPERYLARAVADTDEQIAATAIHGFRKQDFAADKTAATRLHAAQTEASKFCVECRADAPENG
jgi:hypothetical protein